MLTRRALSTNAGEGVDSLPEPPCGAWSGPPRPSTPAGSGSLDIDDDETSWARFPDALALAEDQLALRDGTFLVPRLAPRPRPPTSGSSRPRTARTGSASRPRGPWRT
ncbi:hypothetical protein [Streptomyces sp. KL116D]|uniref:hypothetical protein n=1 Tax=Streptomyces sp. KL116D TaxID=3045152 RepID=UPI0035592CBF